MLVGDLKSIFLLGSKVAPLSLLAIIVIYTLECPSQAIIPLYLGIFWGEKFSQPPIIVTIFLIVVRYFIVGIPLLWGSRSHCFIVGILL